MAAGAFKTGDPQPGSTEPDWSFLRDYVTVEFQLLDPARSRTTWIMEHKGRIFIVSGYMNSVVGRLWKQWPREAERDGRAILRVDGKLYQRQMARIIEGDIVVPVLAEMSRKYLGGAIASPGEVASGGIWLFELKPRSPTKRRSSASPRIFRKSATYSRILVIRATTTNRSTTDASLADVLLQTVDTAFHRGHHVCIAPCGLNLKPHPNGA